MTARGNIGTRFAFDAEALMGKARKLGCAEAEIYETGAVSTPVSFENNHLKSIETTETAVVAVRVIKDGRLGFATSSRAGDDSVVDLAVRAAALGPEAPLSLAAEAPVTSNLKTFDSAVRDWPQEEMLAVGEELIDFAKDLEEGLLASASVEKTTGYTRVATSKGQDVYTEATVFVLFAGLEFVEPDNIIHTWRFEAGRKLAYDLENLKARLAETFRRARRNVPIKGGTYPVIFSPMAAMDLMSPIAACLDGMAVAKGESPWKDRLGDKLFADDFVLTDEPHLPYGLHTTPFDDEGVPTQRRAVIEKGVLRGFFLDQRSARALGATSTGNGFRTSPQSAPSPRPSNLTLQPGDKPLSEIVAGLEEGLYVERLMGAWAGNPYAGQVSGNVHLGFKIEKGKFAGRVKDCMLSVSVFDAFKDKILALSRELEVNPAGERVPYILLDDVNLSTKS